jgi:general secretion pathway protein A
MYKEFFGIPEDPFSITPDPKFLFLSERHREALAHLIFGVTEGGGFVQLTGEVGTGKTLLCRNLLLQLPDELNLALIFNPRQTPLELVASLCDELHVSYPPGCESIKVLVDRLNDFLLDNHRQGRRTVVIIDEAQNLSFEALEQIRLLTNLETNTRKLLQIILVGQPELQTLLAQPQLRQLSQRITARYHLTPLTANETKQYVIHRLQVVGYHRRLFTPSALRLLHRLSGGIPRLINVICGRAMLAAYGRQVERINRRMLRRVAMEIQGKSSPFSWQKSLAWGSALGLSLALGMTFWQARYDLPSWIEIPETLVVKAPPEPNQILRIESNSLEVNEPKTPKTSNPPGDGTPAAGSPSVEVASQQTEPQPPTVRALQVADVVVPAVQATMSKEMVVAPTADQIVKQIDSPLSLVGMLDDVTNAFTTLFGYWQIVYPVTGDSSACEKAQMFGLRCIFGRGSWENLEYYNRPAVIEFLLDNGKRYHVVVSALDKEDVTLDLGQKRATMPRSEVDPLWTGSYILLWRPPKLSTSILTEGSRGEDIVWLMQMLDRAEGRIPKVRTDPAKAIYDWTLKKRVIDFQRSMGLNADGIVGKQTLLKLNTAQNDPTIPLLRRDRG